MTRGFTRIVLGMLVVWAWAALSLLVTYASAIANEQPLDTPGAPGARRHPHP